MKLTKNIALFPALILASAWAPQTQAQEQASFSSMRTLSEEIPGGASPGGEAAKGKLLWLSNTPMGAQDGRLVTMYADAANTELVWEPKGGLHPARDIFTRYSDDNGETWSDPVNLSGTAAHTSASSDWDGDGVAQPYYGDSEKPNVFSSGSTVVVSWVDAYCPEAGVTWGTDAMSSVQGSVAYPDPEVYPNTRVVPFKTVYVAISYDGGTTWEYGQTQPAIQLTRGLRDAKQDVNRGSGKRWAVTWQEDPMGLQQGSADGPGDGSSGATTTKGTDVWYTFVEDISVSPLDLRANRTPLSNQSEYDKTGTNGYPLNPTGGSSSGSGSSPNHPDAGSIENHGSSRANMALVKVDATTFHAVVAYEESKGVPDILVGKTVQYHSFPFNAPVVNGEEGRSYGQPGMTLSPIQLNSRRVRFVAQPATPSAPAIAIFWRQGRTTEGGPADIMCRVAPTVMEADVAAATSLNISSNTPQAGPADMLLDSETNPIEDSNAHRGLLRNNMLVIGWGYTWNGPLARYTDLANYNFWIRRSLDGGVTWDAPQNISNITDTTVTMREPRLVGPAKTASADLDSFITAWGTETNVYEGLNDPESLDTFITHTHDQGATFAKVVPLSAAQPAGEFETQIRLSPTVDEIYAVVMHNDAGDKNALFTKGTMVDMPTTLGTILCVGDGTGQACPCGNESPTDTGAGCANSTGQGALLTGFGSASVVADDMGLQISSTPPNAFMVLTHGRNFGESSTGVMIGDGLLCIGGALLRSTIYLADGTGSVTTGAGIGGGLMAQAGDTYLFQVFYRDSMSSCGNNFNITNALQVTFE